VTNNPEKSFTAADVLCPNSLFFYLKSKDYLKFKNLSLRWLKKREQVSGWAKFKRKETSVKGGGHMTQA